MWLCLVKLREKYEHFFFCSRQAEVREIDDHQGGATDYRQRNTIDTGKWELLYENTGKPSISWEEQMNRGALGRYRHNTWIPKEEEGRTNQESNYPYLFLHCWGRTLSKSNVVSKGFVWLTGHSPSPGDIGAGVWRQELKQRTQRDAAHRLAPYGLLKLLSYTA